MKKLILSLLTVFILLVMVNEITKETETTTLSADQIIEYKSTGKTIINLNGKTIEADDIGKKLFLYKDNNIQSFTLEKETAFFTTNYTINNVKEKNYPTKIYTINNITDQGEVYKDQFYLSSIDINKYNINEGDTIKVYFDGIEIHDIEKLNDKGDI